MFIMRQGKESEVFSCNSRLEYSGRQITTTYSHHTLALWASLHCGGLLPPSISRYLATGQTLSGASPLVARYEVEARASDNETNENFLFFHPRHPCPSKKQTNVRPRHRPALLTRKSTKTPPQPGSPRINPLNNADGDTTTESTTVDRNKEADESMSMSFLQYCATCDKQILGPAQSLYCSDTCRRQDASDVRTPLGVRSSTSNISLPQLSYLASSTNSDLTSKPPRNIVPPASPTARSHLAPWLTPRNGEIPSGTVVVASSPPPTAAVSARPLPRRQNPTCLSTSPRSIELVTPLTYSESVISLPASLNHVMRWNLDGASGRDGDVGRRAGAAINQHGELTPPNVSPK
ncbi:MAG: hypothetical protein M1816_001322 [Peltula sp. TS41687]|nr:MAG: hypothetical protein M1816_001322 [Peltula sp. TS41687]